MMNKSENQMNLLKSEFKKDQEDLEREKNELIDKIKKYKKEDILPKKVKISLWERIKMILIPN